MLLKIALIIGDGKTIWMMDYIENIHTYFNRKIYVTDYYGLTEKEKAFYSNLKVEVISLSAKSKIVRLFKCIYKLTIFVFVNRKAISLLDIQSPPHSVQSMVLKFIADIADAKTIVCFWGSDILRINKKEADRLKGLLRKADKIVLGTNHMRETFADYYGLEFKNKCVSASFGSPAIEAIRKCKDNREMCKLHFDLDSERIVVAIGYNGRKEQNHLSVISSLSQLASTIGDRIQILVHLAYSSDDSYIKQIRDGLNSCGIPFVMLTEQLDIDEIAKLRIATDIIIHAQVSDAFSGSIRESVFAGAILINPAWIHYDQFDTDGVEYIKYEHYCEIPYILERIMTKDIEINSANNTKVIENNYSWNAVKDQWMSILDENKN